MNYKRKIIQKQQKIQNKELLTFSQNIILKRLYINNNFIYNL